MRVRNTGKHAGVVHGIALGATGEVNPDNPGVKIALRAGLLAPVEGEVLPVDLVTLDRGELDRLRADLAEASREAASAIEAKDRAEQAMQGARSQAGSVQAALDAARAEHAAQVDALKAEHAKALDALSTELASTRDALQQARAKLAEQEADLANLTAPGGKKNSKGGDAARS